MPDLAPLRPGDPAEAGAYRLTGRLGEGGQGIVYLATGPDGTQAAVKLLRADLAGDAEASERFVREVAMARRVAPFCTAQVIETGLAGGRPYIVSEYIDGRTLSDVVREQGPRTGAALHRLAVGTVTALVAIHRAGIVHRDFKPSNVVLAPDGPRVIDFGIAKALDLASTLTGTVVGTPSYMAPEQLDEEGPGPKSDMFAWAGTLLFAASGRPPFGQDGVAAVVHRILHAEPDVTCIDDPALRALVADCLAKDPDTRPSAAEALMRLLGHARPRTPDLLQEGSTASRNPARGRRIGWAAAAGVLALAATGTLVAVRLSGPPPRTVTSTPSAAAVTTPATPATRSYTLPGTSVRISERDGDPLRLASYTLDGGKRLYVRKHDTGEFARETRYFEYALDPRTNLALATDVDYSTDLFATVSIVDHVTGARRVVKLSPKPVYPATPRWSPDGERALVTLYKDEGGAAQAYGFGVIDVATGRGEVLRTGEQGAGEWRFFWDAGGRAVGTWTGGAMTFYGLDGKVQRTLKDVGSPVWVEGDDVSPSGGRFLAHCTAAGTALCAHPTTGTGTGTGTVTVPVAAERLIGWWDDDHLAVWRAKDGGYEAVVVDMKGRAVRVLATAGGKAEFDTMGFRFARPAT
ncbi:serine/threonine-protein kinase [Nonomuraea sp. NPDC049421]|uniref:serine/threonine-protein kinase n=1 Tax=Nonomuraea sp. NPDC049421 TaxID=3155275 RepID=UPI00344538AE